MAEKETVITNTDIVNPKKIGIKILHAIANGSGGILQEGISTGITKYVPDEKYAPLVAGAQWLGAGVLSGYIDNEWISSVLGGISAGAAKDLAKNLKAYFEGKMGLKTNDMDTKSKVLVNKVYQNNEDFF